MAGEVAQQSVARGKVLPVQRRIETDVVDEGGVQFAGPLQRVQRLLVCVRRR